MQAAGAALVQGVMDALQQGTQTQQQFQQGAGGTPGSQMGTGGQPAESGAAGFTSLLANKAGSSAVNSMMPQAGPAMQGVPDLNMDQMMQQSATPTAGLSPDILQMLRQRGMML